jgi:hydroxyacylglutathione hydrolase
MIEFKKFTFNPFQENTYLVWHKLTNESAVIDPGCSTKSEEETLSNFINDNNLRVKYLLNTHCHIDHILGNAFIKEKYNCLFFAPELDLPLISNLLNQAEMFGVSAKQSPEPDKFISEELILRLSEVEMKFLFTPGHTPGEYCIYFPSENICFSGDVLFYESIGRTDLWGGNYSTLINSIKTKLLTLPTQTKIYPGHSESTSIQYEIYNNPFLK